MNKRYVGKTKNHPYFAPKGWTDDSNIKPHHGNIVGYCRVSTDKQGHEGLGMKAQKDAINRHLNGGRWQLLKVFEEVESGGNNHRPKLQQALDLCKKHKAKLVIARLDRLARNLYFIASLMESGVEFECCDMPTANKMTIQILAAVAEAERERISHNTKRALQQKKIDGFQLGNPTNLDVAAKKGNDSKIKMADDFANNYLSPIIKQINKAGITSLQGIAEALNARGIKTSRTYYQSSSSVKGAGGTWYPSTVSNYLKRIK